MAIIKRKQNGFTIVELAVTLVVIGVIVLVALGAYKGVRGTMVHVQWQAAIDDAYAALIEFAYKEGYFPANQAEFDDIFNKKVDEYSYGGKVGYDNVAPAIADSTPSSYNKLCVLTNEDISNANQVVFSLKENSRGNRKGKLEDRNVTLAEIQADLRCKASEHLSLSDSVLPTSYPDKDFLTSVLAYGGNPFSDGTYTWCVEVPPIKDMKCATSNTTKPVDMINFFNDLQTFPSAKPFVFSTNCLGITGWTRSAYLSLVFKRSDKRRSWGSDSIPLTVYVKDASGTIASRAYILINSGLYVPEVRGSTCAF